MEEHLHRADEADYFGACPHCGKNDGYVNIGRSQTRRLHEMG